MREELDAAVDSGDERGYSGDAYPAVTPTAADICHAEEASALLRALAAGHPRLQRLVLERDVPLGRPSHCCIS